MNGTSRTTSFASLDPDCRPHVPLPDELGIPLTGAPIARSNAFVVANGTNGVDVFLSLRCSISASLLFFDRQHAQWRHTGFTTIRV